MKRVYIIEVETEKGSNPLSARQIENAVYGCGNFNQIKSVVVKEEK